MNPVAVGTGVVAVGTTESLRSTTTDEAADKAAGEVVDAVTDKAAGETADKVTDEKSVGNPQNPGGV